MASTETRSGFRLPWVSDAHHPEEPAPETDSMDAPDVDASESGAIDAATPDGVTGTRDAEAAPVPAATPPASATTSSPVAASPRRPTKFLADLARAMRAAAETERQEILERFQADAKSFIETVHERSAVEASDLRAAADGDIAGIREWSKAEISRIREETERRITARKAQLEGEAEAHAGRIERQIERVHATVGEFESQMSRFFESLLAEDEPTAFAALASNLPEPPSLEDIAAAATIEPADTIVPEPEAPAEPGALAGEPAEEAIAELTVEPEATAAELTVEPEATAAEAIPAETARPSETIEASSPETLPAETASSEAPTADAAETTDGTAETAVDDKPERSEPSAWPSGDEDLPLDPRVTALGLTPDFDAAEAEAAAALTDDLADDGSGEEVPTIDEETIASRLAGLVPPVAAGAEGAQTRVMVSGLVSVASIAGFKRGLARLQGVQAVSVSSGPDGEFVFAVSHAPGVDIATAIGTLQGFGARVTGSSEDQLDVIAHDPDAA